MNKNYICVFDLETCSADPQTTEITQIAAAILHPNTLEIEDKFESYSKVLDKSLIDLEALRRTRITLDQINSAPHPSLVWKEFVNFCNNYNLSVQNTGKNAPIPAGYNIIGFDLPIINRYCDKYGPEEGVFNGVFKIDLMQEIFLWTENTNDLYNMKLSTIRDWLGLEMTDAHNAMQDVEDTAKIIVKYMNLRRHLYKKVPFKDAFKKSN